MSLCRARVEIKNSKIQNSKFQKLKKFKNTSLLPRAERKRSGDVNAHYDELSSELIYEAAGHPEVFKVLLVEVGGLDGVDMVDGDEDWEGKMG